MSGAPIAGPLGKMLVNDGILTEEQLAAALDRQRKTRERLGQILSRCG